MPKETRSMLLNVGPQHPAMHGIVHLTVELDGETVTSSMSSYRNSRALII